MQNILAGLACAALVGCATHPPARHIAKNSSKLASVPLGTDKADVLKTFGAPFKIEIENNKFKYTYLKSGRSRVTVHFDERNKVAGVSR